MWPLSPLAGQAGAYFFVRPRRPARNRGAWTPPQAWLSLSPCRLCQRRSSMSEMRPLKFSSLVFSSSILPSFLYLYSMMICPYLQHFGLRVFRKTRKIILNLLRIKYGAGPLKRRSWGFSFTPLKEMRFSCQLY